MASPTLTKSLRQDIVQKILRDVPSTDYYNLATNAFRQYLTSLLPTEIQQMLKTDLAIYLTVGYVAWGAPNSHSTFLINVGVRGWPTEKIQWRENFPPALEQQLQDYHQAYLKQQQTRSKLESQLTNALSAFRTISAARKAFPEFEKYFPEGDTAPTYPISVTNVVADLVEAGWPDKKAG